MKKELRKNILLSAIRTAEEKLISEQWDAVKAQLYLANCACRYLIELKNKQKNKQEKAK